MTSEANWVPATLEEKIDRLDALDQIRQLASRYALGVDTRNLDALMELFVEDVRVGKDLTGRPALREWYARSLERFGNSIHFVGNHVIDIMSPDEAKGVVTCRDELEFGDEWQVGMIQYWDNYVRRDGRWYFKRRKLHRWYIVDALKRPGHTAGVNENPGSLITPLLPDAWPSWEKFWEEVGKQPR
jgi:hypothetical protein